MPATATMPCTTPMAPRDTPRAVASSGSTGGTAEKVNCDTPVTLRMSASAGHWGESECGAQGAGHGGGRSRQGRRDPMWIGQTQID